MWCASDIQPSYTFSVQDKKVLVVAPAGSFDRLKGIVSV
jgi:hypothetical protein